MSPGMQLRPSFVEQLETIAHKHAMDTEWLSDYWVCNLFSRQLGRQSVVGGYFAINSAASAQLANDKVATFACLQANSVDAVPHYLLRPRRKSLEECVAEVVARVSFPLVLKPNLESGGVDVFKADSVDLFREMLREVAERYWALTISPFVAIEREARFVVLNERVRFAFSKSWPSGNRKDRSEWRHNLRLGAVPVLLDLDGEVATSALALRACAALGVRFATVDIVTSADKVRVLEVNSSVTMDKFSRSSQLNWRLACSAYEDAILASFGR